MLTEHNSLQIMASRGLPNYVKQCMDEVLGLSDLQSTTPLTTAGWLVAVYHINRVILLGFSDESSTTFMYFSFATNWSKVVMNRWATNVCYVSMSLLIMA